MVIKSRKKLILLFAVVLIIIVGAIVAWNNLASSTKIAFVNYQAITLGQISKANDNNFIKIEELPVEQLDKSDKYDMVFVNGMGLRITDEQRQHLAQAAEKGTPVMTTAATNPQNLIVSVDSIDQVFLKQYLVGGRANYKNLLRYVRKFIDGKKLFSYMPDDPVSSTSSLLYYPIDDDELNFNSVSEFEAYLRKIGKFDDSAKRIILTGQMGVPDSLVNMLQRHGHIVYPVNSIQQLISDGQADSISASAVINMAHGRLGDMVVNYLEKNNIPLFSPLNANRDYDEWMADKMGMNGGFLSQSVVTPEIDGAIRPFTLFAHFQREDGLPHVEAIPDRLKEFVETVDNYLELQSKDNRDKKIAIFYFKGPGQNSLVAEGMEVGPSLYNLLVRLKSEGYSVNNLPDSPETLERMINEEGKVFNSYAKGAKNDFVANVQTETITRVDYDKWCAATFSKEMRNDIDEVDGAFPGHGLKTADGNLALARLKFGNVVLIPQTAAGLGDDDFKIVHGTDAAPPHNYVAAYLWAKNGFGADALIHFGAHGSLEFTPRKQVALGSEDWSDRLVSTMPHFYIYSTSNVGEAMTAKRRSYAGIINYLTPPFMESELRGIYKNLNDAIASYNKIAGADKVDKISLDKASLLVKKYTVELGVHRELRLDSILSKPYSPEDIARIEGFAEELANEKITGALYVMGVPYETKYINSTVLAMTVDPVAYSLYNLDRLRRKTKIDYERQRSRFSQVYGSKARTLVSTLLSAARDVDDLEICRVASITQADLDSARSIMTAINESKDLLSRMMVMGSTAMPTGKETTAKISERPNKSAIKTMMSKSGMSPEKALEMARKMGADEKSIKKMEAAMKKKKGGKPSQTRHSAGMMKPKEYSPEQINFATAITEVERAMKNVNIYKDALSKSPSAELLSIVNALNGGYIPPTSGGDPILNPNILPTGRNMFAVNAEETPSLVAWEKGKALADNTIAMYRKAHGDSIPRKVSYTLWSSEFIETEGATIAQVLYMLGVEPVRDPFGRVTDIKLIPSKELGRPRIDVVVQTSGQLRDLAASRLFLISRAVKMAAEANDKDYPNYVAEGVVESEKHLVDKGVSPKEAREMSSARVFGGVNGKYGSGIQGMVEAGDRWENSSEIAETYINNMGAMYDSEENWEKMQDYAFEAALARTDVVVQPRQSNTWGALSLDHVYEFMGGMNLAVKNVTGKDPDAYLSDYRNRNNVRMQEVKEAIGVESRATILNPTYIKNKMKGGAGDASGFADIVRNTYGWNVMKPDVIDNELWNDIYETYIEDKYNLGTKDYFKSKNPAAIEEITAVMLETARKGMWKATPEQIATLADLHTEVVNEYKPACSGFVCDNAKLRDFISANVSNETAAQYNKAIGSIRAEKAGADDDGMVMQKEELNGMDKITSHINGIIVAAVVIVALVLLLLFIRKRKKQSEE
ncbi:MAG: cobaltochelatase subunit CobN [Prevotella sp.]|nr:cobaltochelatase subunit CobN [Bacteroides sp.]MCM1366845.1 cobaltochelatase subunit CobN [Prevotella sp.]MCM1437195.1 cobaltochelatase subunit CobN [Prevotella sp.]